LIEVHKSITCRVGCFTSDFLVLYSAIKWSFPLCHKDDSKYKLVHDGNEGNLGYPREREWGCIRKR